MISLYSFVSEHDQKIARDKINCFSLRTIFSGNLLWRTRLQFIVPSQRITYLQIYYFLPSVDNVLSVDNYFLYIQNILTIRRRLDT